MFRSKTPRGRYDLDNKQVIGKGGMGVVYRVYDFQLNKDVALKTLRDVPSGRALKLFQREREALVPLNHPNIVDIQDVGELDENGVKKPFFVMPLLPGTPLDRIILAARQRLTIERVVGILCDVCKGLHAAHNKGVIHRDLKPSNIFVMEDDSVKIIDFGLAHMLESHHTLGGEGTPHYMSPEQLERKPITIASDIFSVGVVAYEMFCFKRPFEGRSETEIARAILHDRPVRLSERNPAINQPLTQVVHKALAKLPQHRYSSASDFSEKLRLALRNEPILIVDPSIIRARIEKARRAFEKQDYSLAQEILDELEFEGHVDIEILPLRDLVDRSMRQLKIRGLLEIARKRLQEADLPRSLQKTHEVLELDPDNANALGLKHAIEEVQAEEIIALRLSSARQHIQACAFDSARRDADEILQRKPGDARAQQLLNEIKLCQERSTLYEAAHQAWQNGDDAAALGKMERVLELDKGAPDVDRSATYLNFYNRIRSEREEVNRTQAEATDYIKRGELREARRLTEECLRKYPHYRSLRMLESEIEEQIGLAASNYVAEICNRLEAEPDLDTRARILKPALEQYPDEPYLQETWHLLERRRERVHDIVAKARDCEMRAEWEEGLKCWETLRAAHPEYPGLDIEIRRASEARNKQIEMKSRPLKIAEITQHLDSGDHEKAAELLRKARAEYRDDAELMELTRKADERRARAKRLQTSLVAARASCEQKRFDEAIATLQAARDIDQTNLEVRALLSDAWVAKGTETLDSDLDIAESAIREALRVDPEHDFAKSLLVKICNGRELANHYAARAQQLRQAGDFTSAIVQTDEGLARCRNSVILSELRAVLERELAEQEPHNVRTCDLNQLRALAEDLRRVLDERVRARLYEKARVIAGCYVGDPDFQQLTEEFDEQLRTVGDQGISAPIAGPSAQTLDNPEGGGPALGQSTLESGAVVSDIHEDVRAGERAALSSVPTPAVAYGGSEENVDTTVLNVLLERGERGEARGSNAMQPGQGPGRSRGPVAVAALATLGLVLGGILVYAIALRSARPTPRPQQAAHAPDLKPTLPPPRTPQPSASCTIVGKVRDHRDRPLRSAAVRISDGTGNMVGRTRTDSLGRFRFAALAAGSYVVEVRAASAYQRGLSQHVVLIAGKEAQVGLRFRKSDLKSDGGERSAALQSAGPSSGTEETAGAQKLRSPKPNAMTSNSQSSPGAASRPPVLINPQAVIDFQTNPALNAMILIDGIARGSGPKVVEVVLKLGDHRVQIQPPPGWQPVDQLIHVNKAVFEALTFPLVRSNQAFLKINTIPPGASIFLDGHLLEKRVTPAEIYGAPGKHHLVLSKPGCAAIQADVVAEPGKVVTFGRQLQCR